MNSYVYSRRVRNGEKITKGFIEFDTLERGKKRHIKSVHISERVIQKSVCDYGIVPVIEKSLIYANGASQKGKGTDFAANLLIRDLRRFYRKNGFSNEGYILLGDQHDFFASLRHDVIEDNLNKAVSDEKLRELTMVFINSFDSGLGLGSQVCQICAVGYQSRIDHYIKEVLRCIFYNRYMDDWYIIDKCKEKLRMILDIIKEFYRVLGIKMNEKKTMIVKLSHSFEWLKDRYFLTKTGKVVRKPNRRNITHNRQKLRKLAALLNNGEIGYEVIRNFMASFNGYMKHKNGYWTARNMYKLHNDLIIRRWKNEVSLSEQGECDRGYRGLSKAS